MPLHKNQKYNAYRQSFRQVCIAERKISRIQLFLPPASPLPRSAALDWIHRKLWKLWGFMRGLDRW